MGWEWVPVVGLVVLEVRHTRLQRAVLAASEGRDKEGLLRAITEDTALIQRLLVAHCVTGVCVALAVAAAWIAARQ